ncbi:PAS domain S-box [Archaeoglobus sulfaticallidus PM70-1]|uniref:PAS domain S-box n=1 Tax=Archaeoglobus sulfaticallidus PM70-1 TaxID=387631 RepID=N0BBR2_9EURY|nr:PAS domain S-box protein [Archaeoglobus sulfaticallidus]AGK61029.1 PAS domain S-box [Archaeoglobus sulfaticallidus PM70-1]
MEKWMIKSFNPMEIKKAYRFPIFLKIVLVSLFFSTLSLSLYVATFYFPRRFAFEYLVYIGIILFGTSLFAAGSIVEPIKRVKEGFTKLANGEKAYVKVNTGDELEELADSFNIMAYEIMRQREVIKENEEKYRSLVENINDWVFEINEDLIITYSSSRCLDFLDRSPYEIINRPLLEFIDSQDRHSVMEVLAEKKEFSGLDVRLANQDVVLEISGKPFHDDSGNFKGYRCVARDISLRKKAEQETAYLVSILEHTIDAIVSLDLDTRIVSWNKGAEKMFGYTAEEMVGKPLSTLIPPEKHKDCAENFKKVVNEGFARDIEAIRISKNGKIVVVDQTVTAIHDSQGELTGFVAIMRDITERKKAEMALRTAYKELEERTKELEESKRELEYLAKIVENSNDAIYSIDLDNKITSWNRTAERLFGWRREEILGQDVNIIVPEELKKEISNVKEKIGKENLTYETRRITKDGKIIFVEVTAIPVYDSDGKLTRISFIARDISSKLKAEKELLRRISRYSIEKGKVYLIEHSTDLCDEILSDLIKCGFDGYIFTRRNSEDIKCEGARVFYLSEKENFNTVKPDPKVLRESIIHMQGWNNAVVIDLDYILMKTQFSEVLEFIQEIKDAFYLFSKGVVIFHIDPSLISESELKILKKECESIKQKEHDLPGEVYQLMRHIYMENRVGNRPSIKELMEKFGLARNTIKKRLSYLASRGLIKIEKEGRIKIVELTDKGKDYFVISHRTADTI